MKLVVNAQAKTKSNLRLREGAGTSFATIAILQTDVIVVALESSVKNWVRVKVNGWTLDDKKIYSEPDERSSIKATRNKTWKQVTLTGYVSTTYLTVIDGPTQIF